MQIYDLEQE